MPLKSPRNRSSRVMVVSAWKVERYCSFGAGFWKRYFTGGGWNAQPNQLFSASHGWCVGLTRVKWEPYN